MTTPEQRAALRRACTKFVHGHRERTPAETLEEVAAYCRAHDVPADRYGESAFVQAFETDIAARLGLPAAVFLPSGTMAQQIALRIWCDRAGSDRIGFHATAHLELHEHRAYAHLHGLHATLLGARHRPLVAADLETHPERLAALLVELPAREIGGALPTWDELNSLKSAAAARGVRLHVDGARLWESAAHYERPLAELCAGVDSVYVSFYKGLDALAGCVLAGPADFIAEARIWRKRHGGALFAMTPYVAAARLYMELHLPRFPEYRARARQLARALATVDGLRCAPAEPHINMLHLFLRGEPDALLAARDRIAGDRQLWLAGAFLPADVPGWSRVEIYVGTNAMDVDDAELVGAFRELLAS